ncbi:MAG: ATPase, T2SS/T4P/T4SS family [Candidatus Micrarchaeia archaeon]|jgi:flagellar protein FlaI
MKKKTKTVIKKIKKEEKKISQKEEGEFYSLDYCGINIPIHIKKDKDEKIKIYEIQKKETGKATEAVLEYIKKEMIREVERKIGGKKDISEEEIENEIMDKIKNLLKTKIIGVNEKEVEILSAKIRHDLFGLGEIDLLLADPNLEEIVINSSKESIQVFHKKYGWLKTNLKISNEQQIKNYADIIARKVNRQITTLTPILDANLPSGERANAVLNPVASKGNSITLRKFEKNPWSLPRMITEESKTMSIEVAALLWMCIEYEMNIIVAGGTASGKTSVINALLNFIPPNQRIISIEDTRELYLPDYLHWVPMVTRKPNLEGKGEITMLDLLVNSLRMRPDRIIVGEVRRQREAEVMFEAMHTGHSVYGTIHADNADLTRKRLINPPISLPESTITSIHLILVQYRHRKKGIRRTFEVAEILPIGEGEKSKVNVIYRWNSRTDKLEKIGKSERVIDELMLYSGLDKKGIENELKEKEMILEYMIKNKIFDIDEIEKIVANYYDNQEATVKEIKEKMKR